MKHLRLFFLLLLCVLPSRAQDAVKLMPALPGPPRLPEIGSSRIRAMQEKNRKYPTVRGYRDLAEAFLAINRPADAAAMYRAEAALHRRRGFNEAAMKQDLRAARYDTDIKLFLDRPLTQTEFDATYTRALFEPAVGAFVGAYIDYDEALPTKWQDENWRWHRNPEEFTPLVGRPHATFFMYMGYGSQFPRKWLQKVKDAGAIAHIALEPTDLDAVKNDAYLQGLAKDFASVDVPVFLRYGSEMNGQWTKWHGDPKKYREKFRLVYSVMHKYAPRVALVWCPNAVPLDNIMDYYPGDDACDWVGVNVYSVPFYDNDPRNSAELDSPLALIEPLYKAFADRKPMAICEYGASQMAAADRRYRPDFAITKMAQLYSALPRIYPRIKMISWFDMNTIKHALPGRQLNNYSLSESDEILRAYRKVVSSPYYIEGGKLIEQIKANLAGDFPQPVTAGQTVASGSARFSIWVKAPVARPKVYLQIGKKIVYAGKSVGAHELTLDTRAVAQGAQPVTVYVYDELNRFIASSSVTLRFGKTRGEEPLHLYGTVLHYFADATGYVKALQIDSAGEITMVYFAPQMAQQLLTDFPEGLPIEGWVKPYVEKGTGLYKLVAIGAEKPESFLAEPDDNTSEEGRVTQKPSPRELTQSLLLQSREVRMAGKLGLQPYLPKLARERGGDEPAVAPLMKENVRPW